MWLFWILAGAMAVGAAVLVSWRAAVAARRATATADDADVIMHRRQLAELDELARRELIALDELASTRTEAARRLLAAADRAPPAERPGGSGSRRTAALAAAGAAFVALSLYLKLGSPGARDAPYAARLAAWRAADPRTLAPAPLAAVLQDLSARRPRDPRAFEFLGRAELAADQPGLAAQAFEHAGRLAPRDADLPAQAGEALLQGAGGRISPEAQAAFREALARDPKNALARYHLARARIAAGDLAGGVADWRALASDLPEDDPRRARLEAEIAAASGTPGMPDAATVNAAAAALPADAAGRAQFIRTMVARLAARLHDRPDDAQGWARLVHAYGVLGDARAQQSALSAARRALAGRPQALVMIENEASVAGLATRPIVGR